jgi:hypothetical protein
MYIIEDKGELKGYTSLEKVGQDYGISAITLRQSRRVAHSKGIGWKYLIHGVTLIREAGIVKAKSKRGGLRVKGQKKI